jgi:hypothetical protein
MTRLHGSCVALAILVAGCATTFGGVGTPTNLTVQLVPSAPAGCARIGDIEGSDEVEPQMTPSREAAKADALAQAQRKGATHVVETFAGRCGRYTECYDVTAYRCPAPGASAPGG